MTNNKKILIIEDEGAIIEIFKTKFNGEIEFVEAYSYLSAMGSWKKYNGEFDCIIVDLQISLEGLEIDERIDRYYPLIGLAFIEDICKDLKSDIELEVLKKIIIYSGFTKYLKITDFNSKEKLLENVCCISKDSDSIQLVVNNINRIIYG